MTGRLCEPKNTVFSKGKEWHERYSHKYNLDIKIGKYRYNDTMNAAFTIDGSNYSYDKMVTRFWRRLGAM